MRPKEFSQEVRFQSEEFNGFRLQGGAYYFHQRLKYHELDFDTTGTQDGDVFHNDKNENYGIFASGEYKATDKLTLRAGVRYSHDNQVYSQDYEGLLIPALTGFAYQRLVAPGMRTLPVGVPKLIISSVASGDVAPYVGPADITMMYSVTDVQGLNSISRAVLSNGANAIAGMVKARLDQREAGERAARLFPDDPDSKPLLSPNWGMFA